MKQSNKAMAFNHKGIMEMAETVAEEARRLEAQEIMAGFDKMMTLTPRES